jgi:polyisoprenoid-binding protein YceI
MNMDTRPVQSIFQEAGEPSTWSINGKNSSIRFLIAQRNLIAQPYRTIEGRFNVFTGLIKTTENDFTRAVIDFSVTVDSINTGNARRDRHLTSPAFFDAEQFPLIKFHSPSFKKEKADTYILEGDCIMRGIAKKLTFDVIHEENKQNEFGHTIARFKATTKLNRHDFGIKANVLAEMFIGKEVTIILNLEFAEMDIRIW